MTKVLMLHRVLPNFCADNYYFQRGTAISFAQFRLMLDAIEKHDLTTIAPPKPNHEPHEICITFDDGYADNVEAFNEMLGRGMCATLFPVKNFIRHGFSAIDDMASWLNEITEVPAQLAASLTSGRHKKVLRKLTTKRYRYLRRRWFALDDHTGAARFLTEKQLIDYHRHGIAIGIHGTSHRVWSGISSRQFRDEVAVSAQWLRQLGIRDLAGLCFPHGQYRDCKSAGDEVAAFAEIGLFGADRNYHDPAVTRRIWVKQDTDFARLFSTN